MNLKQLHYCFVGNMLGRNNNHVTSQGQIVADLFIAEGYTVTSVSSKINKAARLAEIVFTLIRGSQTFDIVILEVYSGLYFILASIVGLLCRIFKLPLIMVLHGGNLPNFIQKHPRWAKTILNQADHLIAPSSFLAEKIGDWGYEIEVIPNVINISLFPYCERSIISPRLIWMRSFHSIYNPEMAIEVLARLRESEPAATLVMAGSDKGLENKIKSKAEELGVSDAVRFAGFLDLKKKLKEFSEADIYINTNRIDNMPVSIIEARALGLPVVATNVGGLPYLIEHNENGLLAESENVDLMVKNIKRLLESSELTRKISHNGRMLAEHSAWTSVRRNLELTIIKVLSKTSTNNKIHSFGNKLIP